MCCVDVSVITVVLHSVDDVFFCLFFFFQAEDGIRDLVRSRGLGDVYKRQALSVIQHIVRFSLKIQNIIYKDSCNQDFVLFLIEWLLLIATITLSLIHI